MSRRHFDTTENAERRVKIDEGKRRLPLPDLMAREGLGEHAKKSAHCPFHPDEHKSFSVFTGQDGFWHWKCFAGCGEGDEIMFLRKLKRFPMTDAMNLYLDLAGFSARVPPKSHEYPEPRKSHEFPRFHEFPKSPGSPECPVSLVYRVSNGQGLDRETEKELKVLAARKHAQYTHTLCNPFLAFATVSNSPRQHGQYSQYGRTDSTVLLLYCTDSTVRARTGNCRAVKKGQAYAILHCTC